MTQTNSQIYMAAISLLDNASLGYPVLYPGYTEDPPASGVWIEVSFIPNEGIDNGLRYPDSVIPRGFFQISCVTRPGAGIENLYPVADQVIAVFPKGTTLSGMVRVVKKPWDMPLDKNDQYQPDRMKVVVSVEYSG